MIYRIKVVLKGSKPPIWRRIDVSGDITLAGLHEVIQLAFDWDGYHLHSFRTTLGEFGRPSTDFGQRDHKKVRLAAIAPKVGSKFVYVYDLGDLWEHVVKVEEIGEPDPEVTYPRCVGGRRACPPEDCGGVEGYVKLLELATDPTHKKARWLAGMRGENFDPARFHLAEANARLAEL